MSAILLSGSSETLNQVKTKDSNAFMIDGTKAIVAKHEAIFCLDVLNSIYLNAGFSAYDNRYCQRSQFTIGDDFILQVVHDTKIMGPLKFLNVGYGSYSCPWGIWSIFKKDNKKTLNLEEACDLYNLAKTFTYNYSPYNNMHAHRMSYI